MSKEKTSYTVQYQRMQSRDWYDSSWRCLPSLSDAVSLIESEAGQDLISYGFRFQVVKRTSSEDVVWQQSYK